MLKMISVSEAKQSILNNIEPLTPVTIALQEAAGLVLAEDVFAFIDIPAFNQSSMDGYAFRYQDFAQAKTLEITGEVAAGVNTTFEDLTGKAVRIFTGAPVPEGADTVVMQEKVKTNNKSLLIEERKTGRRRN